MYKVTIWPVGLGETDGGEYGEPETFATLGEAIIRAIGEIAEWAECLADDEMIPAEDKLPGIRQAIQSVETAIDALLDRNGGAGFTANDAYLDLPGTASNDLVRIETARA